MAQDARTNTAASSTEWLVEEDESTRKEAQARAKLAADVAVGIERTLKSYRQFGARHRSSQAFLQDFVKKLGAFADYTEGGELPLSVVGSDLLYDGEPIYSDQEIRTSYPFMLFRDGVQRLVFEPGVTLSEAASFCELLRDQSTMGARVGLEDDIVTALWDANLEHLRVVVNDRFRQDDDDLGKGQRDKLAAQLKADANKPDLAPELAARFVRKQSDKDERRNAADLELAKAWERGQEIVASEEARKALAQQVDSDETLLRKFIEIIFAEILQAKDEAAREELCKLVRDFTVEATRRDHLAEAITVLRVLGDLVAIAQGRGSAEGAEARRMAQRILGAIATQEFMQALMQQLEYADEQGAEQLLTFLALIPAKQSRAMLAHITEVSIADRRRAVCHLLADRMGEDLGSVGELLRTADEGLALDLIYLLRHAKAPRARVELLVALDHGSPTVRRSAFDGLRANARPGDATLVGGAMLLLDDAEPDLRRYALLTLPRSVDGEVGKRLRQVISRDTFDNWDYGDKRRAFLAFAAASGRKASRELAEVLQTHAMFASEALEDRRCAAAYALASLADETTASLLEAETKRMFGSKRVKEACENALNILRFKRPMEQEVAPVAPSAEEATQAWVANLPTPIWADEGRSE